MSPPVFGLNGFNFHILSLCLAAVLLTLGCRRAEQAQPSAAPLKPKEAATQLQQAFASSDADAQKTANVASQALQTADYEAAVQSLQLIRDRGTLTVDQGIAVHNSMVSLESRLINAMSAGDENAKRAYEQLKKARRN